MPFYDHFTQDKKLPTKIGMKLVKIKNERIFKILWNFTKHESVRVLEIGPGRGAFAEECEKREAEYVAIEVNHKLASDLYDNKFNVVKTKAPPLPFKSDSFDIIYMSQVFEHMNNISMAQQLIDECYRLLKKDGILCIISPDYLIWKEDFFNVDYTHSFITTARRLEEIYYENAFEVVYVNYTSGPFFGDMLTYILGVLNRLFTRQKLLRAVTLGLLSEERVYKIRYTFFRSFMIVGAKNE
jgi:SAM-dependent methyltransferase